MDCHSLLQGIFPDWQPVNPEDVLGGVVLLSPRDVSQPACSLLDHGQRAGKSGQARFRSKLCRLLALSAWLYHLDHPCLSLLLCELNQREEDKGSTLPQNSQAPLLHPSHSVSHQVVPGGVSVATGTPEPSDLHFACKDLEELRAALRTRSCKNGQEV